MMKKAEDYLKNVTALTTREELYNIGKQMQIDAIEEVVKLCVENTKVKYKFISTGDYSGHDRAIVDKDSILNCAVILKKKLE